MAATPASGTDTDEGAGSGGWWPWLLALLAALAAAAVWRMRRRPRYVPMSEVSETAATPATEPVLAIDPAAPLDIDLGQQWEQPAADADADAEAPPAAEPETGSTADAKAPSADATAALLSSTVDWEDEAAMHELFGDYEEAARLLRARLEEGGPQGAIGLRLLNNYAITHQTDAFIALAWRLHALRGRDPSIDWQAIESLGREFCPQARLFGGPGLPEEQPLLEAAAEPAADAPEEADATDTPGDGYVEFDSEPGPADADEPPPRSDKVVVFRAPDASAQRDEESDVPPAERPRGRKG